MKTKIITLLLLVPLLAYSQSFTGEKSSWYGFDRYDFVINETSLQITPVKKTDREGTGVKGPEAGTRRCIIVVPKQAAEGKPWTWRGCYWDHQPQAEIELLKRGFHVAYITTDPDATWDVWYKFLTVQHGLSPKPAFIGMSRGGANSFTWGTTYPDRVLAICADNPGLSQTALMNMDKLAQNDVPVLNICGSIDPILHNTYNIERIYHANGGRMSVLIKDGPAHHPHSLHNPNVIADFIENAYKETAATPPSYLPERYTKAAFYSTRKQYVYADEERLWTTKWGPAFTESFAKYSFQLRGVEGAVTVFVPEKAAEGNPWVYRCDQLTGESAVDAELLSRGFHIVVAPVSYNADGPLFEHWNTVYDFFVKQGFAAKPILAGRGAATGEVYAWAIENPDKVAAIYGENPILRSSLAKTQPLDNLKPLITAGIPVIHACGAKDPNLQSQTNAVKKKLGGKMTVILDPNRAHYPLEPDDPQQIANLMEKVKK